MNVKELMEKLKEFKPTAKVIVSNDEELNMLFEGVEVDNLNNTNSIVIYGLWGTDCNDDY